MGRVAWGRQEAGALLLAQEACAVVGVAAETRSSRSLAVTASLDTDRRMPLRLLLLSKCVVLGLVWKRAFLVSDHRGFVAAEISRGVYSPTLVTPPTHVAVCWVSLWNPQPQVLGTHAVPLARPSLPRTRCWPELAGPGRRLPAPSLQKSSSASSLTTVSGQVAVLTLYFLAENLRYA